MEDHPYGEFLARVMRIVIRAHQANRLVKMLYFHWFAAHPKQDYPLKSGWARGRMSTIETLLRMVFLRSAHQVLPPGPAPT